MPLPNAPVLRAVRPLVSAMLVAAGVALFAMACHRRPEPPGCEPKDRANLDFTLKDLSGKDVSLASYRGRTILLNFWATWCGPCKEEMPALVELADAYKSTDLAVLGISVDDTPADLQKFVQTTKVNYPLLVGLGHDELLEAYDAEIGVPVSWVVASNGCRIAKHAGAAPKEWFFSQAKALL